MKMSDASAIALSGLLILHHVGALAGRRPAPAPAPAVRAVLETPGTSAGEPPAAAPFVRSAFVANEIALAVVEPGTPLDELAVNETGADVQWLEKETSCETAP